MFVLGIIIFNYQTYLLILIEDVPLTTTQCSCKRSEIPVLCIEWVYARAKHAD